MKRVSIFSVGTSVLTNYARRNPACPFLKKLYDKGREHDISSYLTGSIPYQKKLEAAVIHDLAKVRKDGNDDFFMVNSSAEINSLLLYDPPVSAVDSIYLLCTDTPVGIVSGRCISGFIKEYMNEPVLDLRMVQSLDIAKSDDLADKGMLNLAREVSKIIHKTEENYSIGINITGAYKIVSGYLMIIGAMLKIPVYYATIGKQLLQMPVLPLNISSLELKSANVCLLIKFLYLSKLSLKDWDVLERQLGKVSRYLAEIHDNEAKITLLGSIVIQDYLASLKNEQIDSVYSFSKTIGPNWEKIKHRCIHRYNSIMAIVYYDLDHFKNINDTYGHLTGDRVLVDFCKTVNSIFPESDEWLFTRKGGDEFVSIHMGMDLRKTDSLLTSLKTKLKEIEDYRNFEPPFEIQSSIGALITVKNSFAKCSLDDLLHKTDMLLYESKKSKGNKTVIKKMH